PGHRERRPQHPGDRRARRLRALAIAWGAVPDAADRPGPGDPVLPARPRRPPDRGRPDGDGPMITTTNRIDIRPRARRVIRAVARLVNPVVLLVAGRRWMPVVGVMHHRGRRSGRAYATPLGMRPLG